MAAGPSHRDAVLARAVARVNDDALTSDWPYQIRPVWLELNEWGELRNFNPDDRPFVLPMYEHAVGMARSFGYMGA